MPYKNKADRNARAKLWRLNNPEKALARSRRDAARPSHIACVRQYYLANKEVIKARAKARQEANHAAHLATCRKHNKSEKFRQTRKEWEQKNPVAALKRQLRRRMILALKEAGIRKTERTHTLIGCTPLALRLWLEAQFKPGMGWHNRSEWHIDHKKPCAAFNLTDVEQQKKCFHYSNLQPLWALENLSKGATYG